MKQRKHYAFTCCALVALALGIMLGAGKMTAGPNDPKTKERPEEGKRVQEFIEAFNRGDAKACASFWTPDGSYVDQDGAEVKGREALEKMYQTLFSDVKGAKLAIKTTSTRQLAPGVAIEEGVSELTLPEGPPSLARFTAVVVQKDDVWYLDSLRESGVKPPSNAEHFRDLEWLIGDWAGENTKGPSGTDSFEWAENQNFLVSAFATTVDGVPVSGGTRWIGWDAAAKQIRSWSFYSGGGFAEGIWTRNDNGSWTIQSTGTTHEGKKVIATHVLTKADPDHAAWQAIKVTVDGQEMAAPPTIKFKRVKEEQPGSR
jgi:uncharacterized protein (TIGR02246 family)